MYEALGVKLNPLGPFNRSLGIFQEQNRGYENHNIHKRVPNQRNRRPNHRQDPQNPATRVRRRLFGSRKSRELVGVGGLAGAGEEEGHEGGSVADGVVDSEYSDGFCAGSTDVEEMKLP